MVSQLASLPCLFNGPTIRKSRRRGINLDAVYRVDVLHAINNDSSDFLERLEGTHGGNSISLDENVTVSEELNGLQAMEISSCQ